MGRRLTGFVHGLIDVNGASCSFGPGDKVPAWAAEQITNPKAWVEVPDEAVPPATVAPDGNSNDDDPSPIRRMAEFGATVDEVAALREMWVEMTDDERAEAIADEAEASDDELSEMLTAWRAAVEANGGDVVAALQSLGDQDLDSGGGGTDQGPPPKAGAGSSSAAWVAYARAHDLEVADDAGREDVIEQLVQAGIPVE
ncbi:MAG: hypothetical protein JWN67_5032 [Actinomycetia bacterium]|nr:hypothetical protein [Actinomycetes bacterium]